MTPERWQQIKAVLNDVLPLPASDRSAFVARVCAEDTSLRREVESFLALGDSQLRTSLSEMACNHIPLPPGTKLGGYEVQSLLGVGGMGEVYRAHDPRLLRDVAIKVLPRASIQDPDRLRRFEQEARAAAALNHPNILAIYDFGATDEGAPYVVSELLQGETLREVLRRGPLPIRKTVELAVQICSGLAAAHERGIIHRDLKPENLFITHDGRPKILDFGLAKLVRNISSSSDSSTLPRETAAGVVMGTIGYMPPEQVRGSQVDQRSDIFALGAILYEMLSGKRAFSGNTPADTMAAILGQDPVPLSVANSSVPLVFDRIVRRCLEKNPNERFHSVRDVAFALEAISDSAQVSTDIPVKRPSPLLRWKAWIAGFAILLLGFGGGLFLYRYRAQSPATQEWEPLTGFSDSVTAPALSPDGHLLAFVRNSSTFVGAGDLYVKLLPRGEPVQLTHDNEMKTNPAFSPDSSRIAYTVAPAWDTRVVPTFGGPAQLLLPNASGLSWIDDRHILFSEKKAGVHMAVVTATESRGEQRDVYVPVAQDGMAHRSSLSPDHKWVLVGSEMGTPDGNMPCRLVPFEGKSLGRIVGPAGPCSYAAWSPDGQWMYFSADVGKGYHLWRQRFPDGTPAQITYGPTEQEGVAPTPDGRSVLTSVGQTTGNIVVLEHGNERSLPFEGLARLMPPQFSTRSIFSPDGSWIYFLGAHSYTGPEELWRQNVTTGVAERALPGISIANSYDISRDGSQVVFDSPDAEGKSHLWIAPLDHHQPPQRLESKTPEAFPLFGPDGTVYFEGQLQGQNYLFRRNPVTGEVQQLLPHPIVRLHTISPDGKWIVAEAAVTGDKATRSVYAYNLTDGAFRRLCYDLCGVLWTLDGKQVYISIFSPGGTSRDYKTFVIPLHRGQDFPDLPANGIQSERDLDHVPRTRIISEYAYPGPDDSRYALGRFTVHRNIFRIPIQ